MKRSLLTLLVILCLLPLTRSSHAIIITWNGGGIPDYNLPDLVIFSEPTTFAYDFRVGPNDLSVTSVGIADFVGDDGLADSHPVGIWTAEGAPVASATVPEGVAGNMIDGYRYADLASPATLYAGTTYVIGTWYADDADLVHTWDPWDPSGHQDFELLAANSARPPSISLLFPSGWTANRPYLGATFGYNIVPEPSTDILFALGGLTMALAARRRIRKRE